MSVADHAPSVAPTGAFPRVDRREWSARVERELEGRPLSSLERPSPTGLRKRPLYVAEDLPADAPLGRRASRGWLRVVGSDDDNDDAPEPTWPARALAAGAQAVEVDAATLERWTPRGVGDHGILVESHAQVELAGPARRVGGFGPLGSRVRGAELPAPLDELLAATPRLVADSSDERPLRVDLGIHRRAGETAVGELGAALASLAELARTGLAPEVLAERTALAFDVGPDLFDEVAKLRAARELWARLFGALGLDAVAPPWIHATAARDGWDADDPLRNALRATSQTFAAAVAGADSIRVPPPGTARADARLARNVQNVLAEEAELARVADPGGGSWLVEQRTDALARAAWERFRAIERDGGLAATLRRGRASGPVGEGIA